MADQTPQQVKTKATAVSPDSSSDDEGRPQVDMEGKKSMSIWDLMRISNVEEILASGPLKKTLSVTTAQGKVWVETRAQFGAGINQGRRPCRSNTACHDAQCAQIHYREEDVCPHPRERNRCLVFGCHKIVVQR